jgi:hypothetical protein
MIRDYYFDIPLGTLIDLFDEFWYLFVPCACSNYYNNGRSCIVKFIVKFTFVFL